jgi:hypothetical protein
VQAERADGAPVELQDPEHVVALELGADALGELRDVDRRLGADPALLGGDRGDDGGERLRVLGGRPPDVQLSGRQARCGSDAVPSRRNLRHRENL